MGTPILVSKKESSMFLIVSTALAVFWLLVAIVVLIGKINFVTFYLSSQQLDTVQITIGITWLLNFVFSIFSLCTVDTLSKSKFNLKTLWKHSKARWSLGVAFIAFVIFSMLVYLLPEKSVYYVVSEGRWYLNSKSSRVIQFFEDDIARIYVWNNILCTATLSVGVNNVIIFHIVNLIKRIDYRLSNSNRRS
jgi:hypothetical protein